MQIILLSYEFITKTKYMYETCYSIWAQLIEISQKFGPHKIRWLHSTSVTRQEWLLTWSFYSGVPPVAVLQRWHPLHSGHSTNAQLPQRPVAWKLQHRDLYIHSIVYPLHRVFIIWPQRHLPNFNTAIMIICLETFTNLLKYKDFLKQQSLYLDPI